MTAIGSSERLVFAAERVEYSLRVSMSTDQNEANQPRRPESNDRRPAVGRSWLLALGVFSVSLGALAPTVGDFGLTWDEPAYRYSQIMSQQWWEQLANVRSSKDAQSAARSRRALLLLALRAAWHQLSSPLGRPVEPGGLRGLRPLDERHPGATDGDRHPVRPDDHARIPVPGEALRILGRRGRGRVAALHAASLRPGASD